MLPNASHGFWQDAQMLWNFWNLLYRIKDYNFPNLVPNLILYFLVLQKKNSHNAFPRFRIMRKKMKLLCLNSKTIIFNILNASNLVTNLIIFLKYFTIVNKLTLVVLPNVILYFKKMPPRIWKSSSWNLYYNFKILDMQKLVPTFILFFNTKIQGTLKCQPWASCCVGMGHRLMTNPPMAISEVL